MDKKERNERPLDIKRAGVLVFCDRDDCAFCVDYACRRACISVSTDGRCDDYREMEAESEE